MASRKEIATENEAVICSVCVRTLLKGEHIDIYIASGGEQKEVCDLCRVRVEEQGWVRETLHRERLGIRGDERRTSGFRGWLRRGREESYQSEPDSDCESVEPVEVSDDAFSAFDPEPELEVSASAAAASVEPEPPAPSSERSASSMNGGLSTGSAPVTQPRRTRGVPIEDTAKVGRSLEIFNSSEHPRTLVGIARSLGTPKVMVATSPEVASEVALVIAWELSWYKFVVDLGDGGSVHLQEKGQEIEEIPDNLCGWNAVIDENGQIEVDA